MDTENTAAGEAHISTDPLEAIMSVREVFAKAANAIVEASALAKVVGELRAEVEKLRQDVEEYRQNNHWLDRQLVEMRRQRDDAEGELAKVKGEFATQKVEHERWLREHDETIGQYDQHVGSQKRTIAEQSEQIALLRKERDEANFRELEATEKANELQAKLDAITKALGLPEPRPSALDVMPSAQVTPFPQTGMGDTPASEGEQGSEGTAQPRTGFAW